MTSEPRGHALVIVNSFDKNPSKQGKGSEAEKRNLLDLLNYLGFKVNPLKHEVLELQIPEILKNIEIIDLKIDIPASESGRCTF
jgi:hypothetical protein